MTKTLLAALLAVFIGLGFATQVSAFDLSKWEWHADCATRDSVYVCSYLDESGQYAELSGKTPNWAEDPKSWEWFVTHNKLPLTTKPTDQAQPMTMYAYKFRAEVGQFASR